MKSKRFERNRRLQKEYGRKPNQNLQDGIVVRHVYGNRDFTLTWWDDTGFNLNGTRISIWWTHPRNDFNEAISDIAHTNVPRFERNTEPDLFDGAEKIYKKVGKSGKRKKLTGYQCSNLNSETRKAWYEKLKAEEERLKLDNDIAIKPFYKVESFDWCRGVSICVPVEVRGIPDLKTLCVLVKKLLKGQTTLDKEFPNYTYTKDDWAKENPENGIFAHAVQT